MLLVRLLTRPCYIPLRSFATAKMGDDGTIYGFTAKDSDGADVSLDRYR
jgi:hypothetical protein